MRLLKRTLVGFDTDGGFRLAAALAYYSVFSLPPLLILLVWGADAVWDPARVSAAIVEQAGALIGPRAGQQIHTMIQSADPPGSAGPLPMLLGAAALFIGASGAFVNLQHALNAVWDVAPRRGGAGGFFLKRLFSFAMILVFGFLLLVSLALSALLGGAASSAAAALPPGVGPEVLVATEAGFSLVLITLLFAAIFKVIPDVEIEWKDVWIGAGVTALLFVAGKALVGFYLGRSDPGSAYGAAGSLVLVFLWVHYSAVILLLGAEFTEVLAEERGRPIRPSAGAVRVERRRVTSERHGSHANRSSA